MLLTEICSKRSITASVLHVQVSHVRHHLLTKTTKTNELTGMIPGHGDGE